MLTGRTSALFIAIVVLAGCGPQAFEIDGDVTLFSETEGSASNCYGTGGYSDISEGLSVTVRDESGMILATSRLDAGRRTGNRCTFAFMVSGVPQAEFYSVEVGRRGALTYSHDEMTANDWQVTASLGR